MGKRNSSKCGQVQAEKGTHLCSVNKVQTFSGLMRQTVWTELQALLTITLIPFLQSENFVNRCVKLAKG